MKKITLWLMSTLTVVVLLFGYHTSTSSANAQGGNTPLASPAQSGTVSGSASSSTSSGSDSSGGTAAASSSAAAASPSAGSGTSGTYTGSQADTRWGLVQVQITVSNGKITKVSVLQYPNNNGRDQQINARALPVLIQETISAQSAHIDMVSGGTVTSEGYVQSLQSALDKAGL
jgi:uncharacterized protein with FMN-binding domain